VVLRREGAASRGRIRQRDGRWVIVDIVGKPQSGRTVPMPKAWTKVLVDSWSDAAASNTGHVFRPMNKGDQVIGPAHRLAGGLAGD